MKLLQSVANDYYKVWQLLQSVTGITKYDKTLLQNVSRITKCENYYKVRRTITKDFFQIRYDYLTLCKKAKKTEMSQY